MSDYLMRSIQSKPVYADKDLSFRDQPFDIRKESNIYIPERKSKILDLITKHESKVQKEKFLKSQREEKYRRRPVTAKPSVSWNIDLNQGGDMRSRPQPKISVTNPEQERKFYEDRQNYPLQKNQRENLYRKRPNTAKQLRKNSGRNSGTSSRTSQSQSSLIPSNDGLSNFTNRKQLHWNGDRFGNYKNRPLSALGRRENRFRKKKGGVPMNQDLRHFHSRKAFKDLLYYDERTKQVSKSQRDDKLVNGLLRDQDRILKDRELTQGLLTIKRMDLMKNSRPKLRINKEPRTKGFIYNDYHRKVANGGYSRKNPSGTLFNR